MDSCSRWPSSATRSLRRPRPRTVRPIFRFARPPTPNRHKQLALYLFDAYAQAVAPATAIETYARAVLDEAYRRAFDTCGIRMQQLAASGADRDTLADQFSAIADEIADLWHRAKAAAAPDPSRP